MRARVAVLPLLRAALRRERLVVGAGLLLPSALAWAWVLGGAGTMEDMDGMLMPMSSGPWTAGHALVMTTMWASMMVAMMLPSAAPMVLVYGSIAERRSARGETVPGAAVFAAGYAAVWTVFSLAATALQFVLERAALLSPMMEATSHGLAGAVLVAAGVYQWTPFKQACLRHCRSPLDFVFTQWREGRRGAFAMGLRHGTYCLGCCWVLMLLLFVGGVMNLAWIAGLSVYVMVEKFAPAGGWIGRTAGAALVAWGLAVLWPLLRTG